MSQVPATTVDTKEPVKMRKSKKVRSFETYWKILFAVISIIMSVLVHKIYMFHTLQYFKDYKKGLFLDLVLYTLPFAALYIIFQYIVHHFLDPWVEKHTLRTDKYPDMETRMKKSYCIVKWGYSAVYYMGASVAAYVLLKDTSFLPPFLGGKGSVYSLPQYRYLQQATVGMQWYYFVQMGKHIGRLFGHLFLKSEGSFYQYLLHHCLSSFLIFFSYTMDMWVIGIFVLFVHDASDIFLGLARGYRQFKNKNQYILNIFYIIATFTWIGLRIFTFGYCCVYAVWYQCIFQVHILNPIEYDVFLFPYYFMAFMLSCLLVMQVYWTYFIVESFINQSVSSKAAAHSYD